jgi:HD domain
MRVLPAAARLYVAGLSLLAAVVVAVAVRTPLDWVDVAVLTALYTVFVSRMPHLSGSGVTMGLGFPVALASFVIVGPFGAVIVGAGGGLLMLQRVPPVKRVYNGAQFGLCAFLAAEAYVLCGGPVGRLTAADFPRVLVPVVVASLVHALMNGVLLTGVLWLAESVPPRQVLVGTLMRSVPSYLGYGVFGLLMAVLWVGLDIGVLAGVLVLLPLVVARWALGQFTEEQKAYRSTIAALVQAVETKDRYTRGHSERVASASVLIARVIGMREDRVNALRYAGILHDVGKLGVPTKLLQKTGGLTEDEFAAIKLHPVRGLEMLSDIEFLDEAFKGILHHHERLDGQGYPMGLRGSQIPEFARVIAVADAFDSMTSTRSYRHARTVVDAIEELQRCKGSQFDPRMVDALVNALSREPWETTGVDEVAESRVGMDLEDALPIDHDDPRFSIAFRDEM